MATAIPGNYPVNGGGRTDHRIKDGDMNIGQGEFSFLPLGISIFYKSSTF